MFPTPDAGATKLTPVVELNASGAVKAPGPPPNAIEKSDVNGSLELDPRKDSPGAAVIVMLFVALVVWPNRLSHCTPDCVKMEPLFQSSATYGCVSVAGIDPDHEFKLVKSIADSHFQTAVPPLLIDDPVPVGATVDAPDVTH